MKKIQVGVNIDTMKVRTKRLGYRRVKIASEKGKALLTNQCLGKERMLSEELRNPSFIVFALV